MDYYCSRMVDGRDDSFDVLYWSDNRVAGAPCGCIWHIFQIVVFSDNL